MPPHPKPIKREKKKYQGLTRSKKPVKKKSARLLKLDPIWYQLRAIKLRECPDCEIGLPGCTGSATEVHHAAGRDGWKYIIYEWFKSACHHCHAIAGVKSSQAIDAEHSLNRGYKAVCDRVREIADHIDEYLAQWGIRLSLTNKRSR